MRVGRPEVLAQASLVVLDQRIRRIEYVPVRAVVLLELDKLDRNVRSAEIALEMLHIGDVGATESVNRLIVVTDRENRGMRAREQLQPLVLQRIGVLEFIDQDVREAAPIVLAQ